MTVDLVLHRESASVISRVNGDVWRYQWCHDLAEAEQLAWEWWDDLPNLLGVGPEDAVDMLTSWSSSP